MTGFSPFLVMAFITFVLASCSPTKASGPRNSSQIASNELSLEPGPATTSGTTDTIDFAECAVYVAKTTAIAATIVQYQAGLVAAGTFTAAEMGVINSMLTSGAFGAALAYMTRHWQPAAYGQAVSEGVQEILDFLQEQAAALESNRTICEQSWQTWTDIRNPTKLPGVTIVPAIMCYAEETPGRGWPQSCGICCAEKWQDHNPGVPLQGFIGACTQECELGRQGVSGEMGSSATDTQDFDDDLMDGVEKEQGFQP